MYPKIEKVEETQDPEKNEKMTEKKAKEKPEEDVRERRNLDLHLLAQSSTHHSSLMTRMSSSDVCMFIHMSS